ncbi:hypothetical protein HJC99_04680 [Candidatus Saccharibacteria bacterium]|nr:hypothetical protein [Candidatus Saccharibacteria bacterium]
MTNTVVNPAADIDFRLVLRLCAAIQATAEGTPAPPLGKESLSAQLLRLCAQNNIRVDNYVDDLADVPFSDLVPHLSGHQSSAVPILMERHLWINRLADCSFVTEAELGRLLGMGPMKLQALIDLLEEAHVTVGSLAKYQRSGYKFLDELVPPAQFRAIPLRWADSWIGVKCTLDHQHRPDVYISDTTLAALDLRTLGDLRGQTIDSINSRQLQANGQNMPPHVAIFLWQIASHCDIKL